MAGDDMTALEAWRQMAMAENIRAQRNWQGLENDKPVSLREIRPVAKARPDELQSAKALRKRIQRLHLDGLDPDDIVAQLACPETQVEKYLRGLVLYGKHKEPARTKALRMRIQRLHLDGLDPDEIATQIACPEALVWKDLRALYKEGNNLSDDYRHLRVARIYALKQQGLALQDIAALMGVNKVLVNKDMREMPQQQVHAAVARKNMRKEPAWLNIQTPSRRQR